MKLQRYSPDFKRGGVNYHPLGEYVTYADYEKATNVKPPLIPLSKRKLASQKPLPYSTEVPRFSLGHDPMNGEGVMIEDAKGNYVSHLEYAWMANYTDRLVEVGNLPCLPADLANLREANTALATENEELKRLLTDIKKDLILLTL